ncbi:GspH/FimT family pseudopilin [Dyella koreensis]|uniref:Type II secretion system protein H n=2 Tax=Dyella koreensis TaxID=311235 RepID=A0ABW8K568_9GAMM
MSVRGSLREGWAALRPASAGRDARLGRRVGGFTMVELMVTLGVVAILVVVAVPSFKNMIISNKLTTAANDVVTALNVARMEAIKRNGSTGFCSDSATNNTSDTLGSACTQNGVVQTGAVYVLTSGTNTNPVRGMVVGITSPLKLNSSMIALRYNGTGLARKAGDTSVYDGQIADICTSAISSYNHRTIKMAAGSILVTDASSGACP